MEERKRRTWGRRERKEIKEGEREETEKEWEGEKSEHGGRERGRRK